MSLVQEDLITIMNISDSSDTDSRYFLAGQGFGSSHCHLEPHPVNTVSIYNMYCMHNRSPTPFEIFLFVICSSLEITCQSLTSNF